jgi:hypothetical protein
LAAARVEINSVFCLSMMLGFRARLELELGQIDEAYADIVALQKLANGFAADPINLVHLLVGISMHGTAAEVVNDGCRKHAWTHAHLGRFQELLGELRPVAGFRNAMRSERAGVLYCIDHSPQTPALGVDWPWWLFPGWVQQNKLVYCRDLEERILVRLQPGAHRVLARPQNASPVSTAGKAGLTSPYRWLTRLCLSNLEGILENAAVAAEKLNLNLTAWAVERYRLAHGEYPRDLAVLVPAFIAQRPQGVLNGLPISFQRMSAKKLKIYSVGWDACDDDGGKDDVGIEITG